MKKIVFVLLAGLMLVISTNACKSSQDCPAYSQSASKVSTEKA